MDKLNNLFDLETEIMAGSKGQIIETCFDFKEVQNVNEWQEYWSKLCDIAEENKISSISFKDFKIIFYKNSVNI